MPRAFAPGRVNLIGEHTDYNDGLCLPFAVALGVTVEARPRDDGVIRVHADDLAEEDAFAAAGPTPTGGWRAHPRGVVAELARVGVRLAGAELTISSTVPAGAGLSSSAALDVALVLALAALGGRPAALGATPAARGESPAAPVATPAARGERSAARGESPAALGATPAALGELEVARLAQRVEHAWVGARTGLLDQLACLRGRPDQAVRLDMRTLGGTPVAIALPGWSFAVLDSGERHVHAESGYNARRDECDRALAALGLASLRDATVADAARLPEPLGRRVRHVVEENGRVEAMVDALARGDGAAVGALLDASHASLRDLYEVSTPTVDATVQGLRDAGAAGARVMGGGFGGSAVAIFGPGVEPPAEAIVVRPAAGAGLL